MTIQQNPSIQVLLILHLIIENMRDFFKQLFDWTEVWALLIPLVFILRRKVIPAFLKPVKIYVFAALALNLFAILIWKRYRLGLNLPDWLGSNNFIYNTHSLVRFALFTWFFLALGQHFMHRVKKILPFLFMAFVIINFIFYEDFFRYAMPSSRLLATEAALLLFYCLQYFIYMLLEDRNISVTRQPDFWVATGLSIYEAVSFTIFLFFNYLIAHNIKFAISIWDVSNVAFIIFCICLSRAFHEKSK